VFGVQEGELSVGEEGDWYVCGGHFAFFFGGSVCFLVLVRVDLDDFEVIWISWGSVSAGI